MTDQPTPDQIAKLPKWARDHIDNLVRQRTVAVRSLNDFCDASTPSPFKINESVCTGEERGPSNKTSYVQAHTIVVEWKGVELTVSAHDYGNGSGIKLSWSTIGHTMREVAFVPESYQSARLVAKEFMS